jgi:flagellar basal body-associated protein FliL
MPDSRDSSDRAIWLAIILIVAFLVAGGTALLFYALRASASETATRAGAAFVATLTLGIAIYRFICYIDR